MTEFARADDEAQGVPKIMEWEGREIELPPSLPAVVMLRMARLQREAGPEGEVPADQVEALLVDLFGSWERLEAVLRETRVPLDLLPDFLAAAAGVYQEEAPGNRQARRQKAGRRSTS